jgi:hypothetical protein
MPINDAHPHSDARGDVGEGQPIDPVQVRQGRLGMRTVWVLVISLVLATLATFGLWVWHAPKFATTNSGTSAHLAGRAYPVPASPARRQGSPPAQNPSR